MHQRREETMSREEIRLHQLERLRGTIRRIRDRNPAYHERLGRPEPGDIKTLADIARFPFITKEDLRQGYPLGLACASTAELSRMHMSSGTTGTPIINPYTFADVEQWSEIMARCYACAGVGPEDTVQITPSFGLFNGGFGFHYGASRVGAFIVPIGAGRTTLQLQFIRDLGTTALTAIASYPLRLLEVAREEGFDWGKTRLRTGIFGAEVWSDEMRRHIEEEMGIRTYDILGMTETGGVGLGIDCPARAGAHVWEDHYLVEILDPQTGEAVPDGKPGEMVITTLTREGLPLIRFRTRDITSVVSREKCDCGRTHLRVARITGRCDDMIKVKGINFYPRQVESLLLSVPGVGPEYRIEVSRRGGADHLRIVVEVGDPGDRELAARLAAILEDALALGAEMALCTRGSLERPAGKASRVTDSRARG